MARERDFQRLLRQMQSRDPERAEEGFSGLALRVGEFEDLLLEEYRSSTAEGAGDFPSTARRRCRAWLLELLSATGSEHLIPVFSDALGDEEVQHWAIRGLERIDTKEARRILWVAGIEDV